MEILEELENLSKLEWQILMLRYVCNKSWKEIAEILKYDIRQVYRIKNNALKSLNVTIVTFLQKDVTMVTD